MLLSAWLPLLAVVVWRDVTTRTIPDAASLALAVLGFGHNLVLYPYTLAFSMTAAMALFGVLFLLFARGALGGGDVKLMAALALGMSALEIWHFVVATALAGGVLALLYLLLSRLLPTPSAHPAASNILRRLARVEAWRIRRRGPLPYGVAIATGCVAILLQRALA